MEALDQDFVTDFVTISGHQGRDKMLNSIAETEASADLYWGFIYHGVFVPLVIHLVHQSQSHKEDEGKIDHKMDFVNHAMRNKCCYASH